MIPKTEILELATRTNLNPYVVEKDYMLGWLLAAISQHPVLSETWVFKGGTCLKKCYFETYRFSEDLDFTLLDPSHINETFLRETFSSISEWIYENSGIEIPAERLAFDIYKNPRGVESCQGKVFYRGPVSPSGKHNMPRIKLDLTADEIVADTPVVRPVRHDYSDTPEGGISILSYSYIEVFAEKIRALKERTRPRDLYDVINFFRRPESNDLAPQVSSVLTKKCEYKSISFPQLENLQEHKEICEGGWKDQLAHQLPSLPPFQSFWDELGRFFNWLLGTAQTTTTPTSISNKLGETIDSSLWLRAGATISPLLDRVRFAAVNRLCVELDYRKENGQRQTYLIEPYSLRATNQGNILLYGVKLPDVEIRGFRTDRILGVRSSERAFSPRFQVDFIPEGPVNLNVQLAPFHISHTRSYKEAPTANYVFECPLCDKHFRREKYNNKLNPHKDKYGYPCRGRVGILV